MPGANFPRVHVWSDDEDVNAIDLNAEFDNILNNLNPAGITGYETDVTQMQKQTDPGALGSEVLATSEAGEIERLRFVMARALGNDYWYESPAINLNDVNMQLAGIAPSSGNRIVSGRTRASSNQALALQAGGITDTVLLRAATTPFSYYVADTAYSTNTDYTLVGLTTAPSSNNTCVVDDATLSLQEYTKTLGEYGTTITVTSMGSAMQGMVGRYAALSVNNGSSTEYFIAYVQSSTQLVRASRGYFFDHTDTPVPRITIANGNTITLLKLTWLFVDTSGALKASYNPPVYQKKTPLGASAGDYWFDTANRIWNVYSGTGFSPANTTLVGVCAQDTTNCIGSRTYEYYALYNSINTVEIEYADANQVRATQQNTRVSVAGNLLTYTGELVAFNMGSDLDAGLSEQSSTAYFCYITDQGDSVLSDISPYDRRGDLQGMYHPYNPWRCVGRVFNDSSSDFDSTNMLTEELQDLRATPVAKMDSFGTPRAVPGYLLCAGAQANRVIFSALFGAVGIAHGQGDGSTTFNLPDTRGYVMRSQDMAAGRDPNASSRSAAATGGNSGDAVGSVQSDQFANHAHGFSIDLYNNDDQFTGKISTAGPNPFAGSPYTGSTASVGGSETRGKNLGVVYWIKY